MVNDLKTIEKLVSERRLSAKRKHILEDGVIIALSLSADLAPLTYRREILDLPKLFSQDITYLSRDERMSKKRKEEIKYDCLYRLLSPPTDRRLEFS